jgi:hypothetical protein
MSCNHCSKIMLESVQSVVDEIRHVHITRDKIVFTGEGKAFLERIPQGFLSLEDLEKLFHILHQCKGPPIWSTENLYPGYASCVGTLAEFVVDRITTTTLPVRIQARAIQEEREFVNSMRFLITSIEVDPFSWDEKKDEPVTETKQLYVVK